MKEKRYRIVLAVLLFMVGLFLTELSPWSAAAVAQCNGGYGTFDMKHYSAPVYRQIMHATTDFSVYWKYYICDFIFIGVFLYLMFQLVRVFGGERKGTVHWIAYGLAVVRAGLDAAENVILLVAIYRYPKVEDYVLTICNGVTRAKFMCMGCFFISLVGLLFWQRSRTQRTPAAYKEQAGIEKKSFELNYRGGSIWCEHLDSMGMREQEVLEKLAADEPKFSRPSVSSHMILNLDETQMTEKIVDGIEEKIFKCSKSFVKIAFVGVEREYRASIKKRLKRYPVMTSFFKDYEKAKEWVV